MTVYLVGAGPGDPGLLTLRGAEVLSRADVVVHDRLSDPSLLDMAPDGALRVDVGKRPGGPVEQDEINSLLVERGRAGLEVVRLKGGDPFVFGRGGEEAQALFEAGVEFEVVPGVSAAVAVPAYAGVPVTHRGLSTSFVVVTGHSAQRLEREVDWEAVGRLGGTVVVLMGVAHRADIAKRLMEAGRSPDTPVVAVSHGTRPAQSTVRTTLEGLGAAELDTPATIVIGAVARLDLSWFDRRPLLGMRVVVTRARHQATKLGARLRSLGAEPVEAPVISIGPPSDGGSGLRRALARLGSYDWVVFTSANAVGPVFAELRDARDLGRCKVAAIGPATAGELRRFGIVPDVVPDSFVAEALAEAIIGAAAAPAAGPAADPAWAGPEGGGTRGRVLLPRAAEARDALPAGLRDAAWEVDVVEAYRTVQLGLPAGVAEAVRSADAVTFTSSSTVRALLDVVGPNGLPRLVACIGPITAATARDAGVDVQVTSDVHTVEGLLRALVDHVRRAPGR